MLALVTTAETGRPSASGVVVAIDTDPTGNGPRTVGSIEDCRSLEPDQTLEVDVVLPSPGIPTDRGLAGYELRLFYDPNILWITDEDGNQLLKQAPGSTIFPFTESRPSNDGDYGSLAVDFGSGIEPFGASETGPGVITRLTLAAQRSGSSPLVLRGPRIFDDTSREITIDALQSATIYVGQPCPISVQTPEPTPSTPASPPVPTAAARSNPFPVTGGTPHSPVGLPWWLFATGIGMSLAGIVALTRAVLPDRVDPYLEGYDGKKLR
jgi:hypothetical protein